jgi:hypothetical protein
VHGIEPNLGEIVPLIEELGSKANPSIDKEDIFFDDREMRNEIGNYWTIELSYRET